MISEQIQNLIQRLNKVDLSIEDRTALCTAVLDKLQVVPIRKVIDHTIDGDFLINGKPLMVDQLLSFRESIVALKHNAARQLIRDQMTYEAVKMGVHQGMTPEAILFSKAIIWQMQQEEKLLEEIN